MPSRINRAIELLAQDQAIYYDGPHSGHVLTHAQGMEDARTWADYINVGMEHGAFDMTGLAEYMRGLVDGGPTRSGHRTPAVIVEAPVSEAPVETPSVYGVANASRSIDWNRLPASASAPPATRPSIVRDARSSVRMAQSGFCRAHTRARSSFVGPTNGSTVAATRNAMADSPIHRRADRAVTALIGIAPRAPRRRPPRRGVGSRTTAASRAGRAQRQSADRVRWCVPQAR